MEFVHLKSVVQYMTILLLNDYTYAKEDCDRYL